MVWNMMNVVTTLQLSHIGDSEGLLQTHMYIESIFVKCTFLSLLSGGFVINFIRKYLSAEGKFLLISNNIKLL